MENLLVEELNVDLQEALSRDPLISKELQTKMAVNPKFLDWWKDDEPVNEHIVEALIEATKANDYGEHDNYDYIIKSMWSKQKGVGKSSVAIALKIMYDENITENGFCIEEIFFTIPEKLDYIKERESELTNRMFVLDEMVPLIGQSSTTNTLRMLRIDDTTRIKGYNNCYVSPRGEELFSHDYYIQVALKDKENNTLVCCLNARDGTALGWLGFPRPRLSIWKKYQKKKLNFLKQLETGHIREMQFKELYERVDERFRMEDKFVAERDYKVDINRWHEEDGKGRKPRRPKIIVTPARVKNWLVAISPEQTNQELETGSEVIYSILENKFREVKKGE